MSSSVFRNSSLDRVSSPEQLNDYIKVSNPSVWVILAAAVIFLIGVVVWGIFGTLTTTKEAVAVANRGNVICFVSADNAGKISAGMEVRIGDSVGTVLSVSSSPIQIGEDFDPYALYLTRLKVGDWVYQVSVQTSVEEGVYPAQIIIETLSPISFVLN